MWSNSQSVNTTPSIRVPRSLRPAGASGGNAAICEDKSGEALKRSQRRLSAVTAIEDCVR
jgi:hypothetical protein